MLLISLFHQHPVSQTVIQVVSPVLCICHLLVYSSFSVYIKMLKLYFLTKFSLHLREFILKLLY